MKKRNGKNKSLRRFAAALILPALTLAALIVSHAAFAGSEEKKTRQQLVSPLSDPNLPAHIDLRRDALSKVSAIRLEDVQKQSITALEKRLGGEQNLKVIYNGLTSTPSRVFNPQGYLTAPSGELPETIARNFIRQNSEMFRFTDDDLNSLKLQSRATTPEGTTIMLFQQNVGGVPVYQGEVLVNVNKTGQIINVGGMNYPQMSLSGGFDIPAAQAVASAAQAMKINFYPESIGKAQILATYGNLKPTYTAGEKFSGGDVFSNDISVQKVIFPLGAEGRAAYKFVLTTPQFYGIMWQNIVDAQTGEILQRLSLTAFQNEPGGGTGNNRRGTFRPDVQNMVESYYRASGANGKVFDLYPATLSGKAGAGRTVRTGIDGSYVYTNPTYQSELLDTNYFRYSMVNARIESTLFFNAASGQTFTQAQFPGILGQVTRGLPDATYPSASSPFGWFYLPTGSNGTEITTGDSNRAATRVPGYTMSSEAQTRNLGVNSPTGDKSQPFSADVTPLSASKTLNDGRILNSVFQSRYTEGNNVAVSDDHANDNSTTNGVKGYSLTRQFTDPRFNYFSTYELGGVNASGGGTGSTTPVTYPASANTDIYPGTVSLFYFNNVEHDYLYSIGFTEQMWNFQFDNFGKGGAGGDAIVAEVQDGSGTDNANMGTPDEGASPRMQMYLFTDGGFRRSDGDFDWDVIAHEHYHGVSNRSAGKGSTSCLGTPLVGESGGMGEGWSDFIASSMSDDDNEGEHVTGDQDKGIRRIPYTNYRYSYGSINDVNLNVRQNLTATDNGVGDQNPGGVPYEVHDIGEVWAAALWDMRELMIVKQKVGNTFPGIFFDGTRRTGGGTTFYIGERPVRSIDTGHPINYRLGFGTDTGTVTPFPLPVGTKLNASDIVRPGMLAAENAANSGRSGPLATAVSNGARLADKITLRGLQLAPCNPTFVDMRDSMIAADREITGGENIAIIWRAFASHGVGVMAISSNTGVGGAGPVVEDFTVPANVSACELQGPLPAPAFTVTNNAPNSVHITVTTVPGAEQYIFQRSTSPNGIYTTFASGAASSATFNVDDNNGGAGLILGQTYYYQVHARRNTECIGSSELHSITITSGTPAVLSPIFLGVDSVNDPRNGTSLTLNWSAAISANPTANIVYDVYRINNVVLDNDTTAPTFTPSATNRIAQGLTTTTYTNTGLTLGQQYYYIVRARDTNNGQTDTNNVGNTRTKFNAPTSNNVVSTAFALENFSTTTADGRFTPQLTESATPNVGTPVFQRVPDTVSNPGAMYAPDFDPASSGQGGPSNFAALTQLTGLTRASILEFDHRFSTEATFDGGNLEIVLGSPTANPADATPYPNNISTFELNDYLIENGYTGALTGLIEGVPSSPLTGRLSYTGAGSLSHVRAALGDFAPGGIRNPNSLPVYLRFHMSSDPGSNAGTASGWYIDNLVVNNFATAVATISISGTVTKNGSALSGATVTLAGTNSATTTTDTSGQYTFPNLTSGGNYRVTPTSSGTTFEPLNRNYSNVTGNITGADFVGYDTNSFPRTLSVVNSFATPGQSVTVPVSLNSLGNEAGLSFSLNYDTTRLSDPTVTCGSDAAGCTVTTNSGTNAIGVTIDGVSFTAGTRQVATITFNTTANPPNTASNTPLVFVDSPTPRSFSSGNADSLASRYIDGLVVFAQNLECDVAGRSTGDGDVLINDLTIMRQFVARNITPDPNYNEFQRADCGDRGISGDGHILSNDLIQARRYAARNDALQPAAGPNQELTSFVENLLPTKESDNSKAVAANPVVRVTTRSSSRSATVTVPIEVDVSGDVTGFGFSIEYDTTKLTYQSSSLGSGVPQGDTSLTRNTSRTTNSPTGKLGIVIDSGTSFATGTRQLVTVTFAVAANAPYGTTPITVSSDPTPRSTSDSQANLVTTTYTDGGVNISVPTAANISVSGRVLTASGSGVINALVKITDGNGAIRTARTNSFGYYNFANVAGGGNYVIGVSSKGYTFPQRVLDIQEDVSDADFIAEQNN